MRLATNCRARRAPGGARNSLFETFMFSIICFCSWLILIPVDVFSDDSGAALLAVAAQHPKAPYLPGQGEELGTLLKAASHPLMVTIVASELHDKYHTAAQMALDRFNLTNQQVQVTVVDSECDYRKALTRLIRQREQADIDVLVLEPRCREVAYRVTDFASEWEVPVVSPIPLQRTERKRTLIQLTAEYGVYGIMLQELFDHFKWNRAAFLTSTVDPECPTAVTEIYNILMKSNSSVAHDIYEEKLKPPDYKEVLLKTAQYAKIVVTCLTEQSLRSLLKASEDLGYTDTGRMFFINVQLPTKHFSDYVPYSRNLLNIRTKPMLQGKVIRDQIKQRVEFLSETNYTKLIQVYDSVFLYGSVVQESRVLLSAHPGAPLYTREPPKVMLERLLNKSSFNSGSTEEMHLSQGRPQIELQVVSYDGGRAKVVFVLSEREESHGHELTDLVHTGTYGNLQRPMHTTNTAHMAPHVPIIHEMDKKGNLKLLQVGTIDWVGGHVPNDQPWGDPGGLRPIPF
ncbi:uncharacterized protein LOC111251952 isoform X3 [Varroa destructor]|uniref:Receptor ligand binding region domain-containing protein n=2 Tax=Varroa TaxID=62624 RepID=A0A7M7MBU3_VARDE|nr:uncharacterized protein LOC111251952 isoform X3 [Varroa destructor]